MDNPKSAATAPDELRRIAEERLKAKPLPRSEMDTLRLLHELQVHQIELEMQNEELHQAKNNAEALQEKYTDLYDFAPAGYFTLDHFSTILNVNLAGADLLGVERSQLIGRRVQDFVAVNASPAFNDFLIKCKEIKCNVSVEIPLQVKGSQPIFVQIDAASCNARQECFLTVIDITDRKQAEAALRDSEELYRAIGESIDYGVWVCDPEGRNFYASPSFLKLVGLTQDQCSNFGWGDVLHPDDSGNTISAWKECARTGAMWNIEHRFYGVDGQWHPILARGVPVRDDNGNIKLWAGINLDISERKKMEEVNQDLLARTTNILESITDAFFTLDREWRITFVNKRSALIMHKPKEELIGQNLWEIFPEAVGSIFYDHYQKAMNDQVTTVFEGFYPPFDAWYDVHVYPFEDGISVYFNDITERKTLEAALAEKRLKLNELNKTLEQRVETQVAEIKHKDQMLMRQTRQAAMGQMIDNIAHQWRQPLNSLGLTIQQIPLYYDTKDFNREFLEECSDKAMKTIQHMSQTIDDFKNFFNIDKEKIDFEIDQLIQKTVSLVEASFWDQHISVTVHCEHKLHLAGFPNEYSQIILIILNNARDVLAERRNINGQVVIKAFKENDATVMTITDNAGGIPEDIIDKIFDPYFTTKAEDKGTGIGLSMAKNIIENSFGGGLTARNTGDGAEFRIEV